jgi:hypothetical protein
MGCLYHPTVFYQWGGKHMRVESATHLADPQPAPPRRHQRGDETAAGVPYDSVEEPKKNPVEREERKHR